MKIKDIGEFGLIRKLTENDPINGDDAAVVANKPGEYSVLSSEMYVENIHFDRKLMTWEQIGFKAMVVTISDMAAMGAEPKYILINLALPKNEDTKNIDNLYKGFKRAEKKYKCKIVGGDISGIGHSQLVISITCVGQTKNKKYITRSGAKPGDLIYMTGYPGMSAVGLHILRNNKRKDAINRVSITRHIEPTARIKEGLIITSCYPSREQSRLFPTGGGGATAMIDSSDGLLRSINEICHAGKTGANLYLDKIPIHAELKKYPNAQDFILHGGEDYELIFTIKKKHAKQFEKYFKRKTKTKITCIGEITTAKNGITIYNDENGVRTTLGLSLQKIPLGFDHFK